MAATAQAADLPKGFVRLKDAVPDIRQDIRYAGTDNFLGRKVDGYRGSVCIVTRQAADALAKVQEALRKTGETLVAFDCYRPTRAVADFVAWAAEGGETNPQWYPHVRRGDLIAEGYIASRSAHSRGSTVDVAIRPNDPAKAGPEPACGARGAAILDFGTGFDCFDPAAHTDAADIPAAAKAKRKRLVELMRQAGFRNYSGEWWHFTLEGEPFAKRFDFTVE